MPDIFFYVKSISYANNLTVREKIWNSALEKSDFKLKATFSGISELIKLQSSP